MGDFNKAALMRAAAELERLFMNYRQNSGDVAAAYEQCKPLIEKAKNGGITSPAGERLPANYFSTEFDLINYRDLYHAASLFDMYLEGWESEEAYNAHVKKMLEE
jgi:hypothetical protein